MPYWRSTTRKVCHFRNTSTLSPRNLKETAKKKWNCDKFEKLVGQGAGLQFPEQVLLTHLASKVVNHLAKSKLGPYTRWWACTAGFLFLSHLVKRRGETWGRMCSGRLDLKQVADLSAGTSLGCLHICVKSICPLDIRASPVKRCDSLHFSFP